MVTPLKEGAVVDGYRVRALLFCSAAFDAYSAIDPRGAAVCLLHRAHGQRDLPPDDAFAADLEKLKALNSKWLPKVLSGGRDDSASWVVTEAIGGTAAVWTPGEAPISWLRVVITGRRVANALHSAAEVNLHHGSLEPQCIRKWKKGRIWVIGVGIARLFGLDVETVLGSPRYFAPEQVIGSPIPTSPSVDIHALGMCLHGALLGREPYEGAKSDQLLGLVQHGSPGIVVSDEIPFQVWEFIAKSTAKDPRARFGDWEEAMAMCGWVLALCANQADEKDLKEILVEGLDDMGPNTRKGFEAWIERPKPPDGAPDEASTEEQGSGKEIETPRSPPEPQIESDSSPLEPAPTVGSPPAEGPTTQRVPALLPVEGSPANDVRKSPSPVFEALIPEPAPAKEVERPRAVRWRAEGIATALLGLVAAGALLLWTRRPPPPVLANHSPDVAPALLEAASKSAERAGARRPGPEPATPSFNDAPRRTRPRERGDDGDGQVGWPEVCGPIYNCKHFDPLR